MRNKCGLNIGDEKEIKVKFPDDYRKSLLLEKMHHFILRLKMFKKELKRLQLMIN